jgi:ketosteroid isomerase-like protein
MLGFMDRSDAMAWVAAYERAWRAGDTEAVPTLFTQDAEYWCAPYADPEIGHAAIQEFWEDDAGRTFRVEAEPVAVDGAVAVVRLHVRYLTPKASDYRDLWVLQFAADGRVEKFEEWAFFPGQKSSAED